MTHELVPDEMECSTGSVTVTHELVPDEMECSTESVTRTHETTSNQMELSGQKVTTTVPQQAEYGGYDFTFARPVPNRLQCTICTKVLRDPHLTECCGQNLCESCLKHWFKKQNTTCPHCRHENFIHILNKPLKREIDELEIRCTKQGASCQWVGELSSLQAHLNSDEGCGYVEVQCKNKCGAKMTRKELEAHLVEQCPLRSIQCQYCQYENTYQTITTQHYTECPNYPLPCPNKCGTTGIQRAAMDNHRSICELEPVECPFQEAGCTVRVVRRQFDAHMSGNQQNHVLILLGAFQKTRKELNESQRKLSEYENKLGNCQRKLGECEKTLSVCQKELGECRKDHEKLNNTTLKLLETREELEAAKSKPTNHQLKVDGDEVTFCMTDFSLYKQTGKVWHSQPFYCEDGYKLCLAVYANGKGAGAGTHVSVELLQMRGEHDEELRLKKKMAVDLEAPNAQKHVKFDISIQMNAQCKKADAPEIEFSLQDCLCSLYFFNHLLPKEDLQAQYKCTISKYQFIDDKSADELMVLNDTILLRVTLANFQECLHCQFTKTKALCTLA